ncbi:hypothetical protein B1813_15195 [Saccharomonospora piscinae]|uniref:Uncharacterized protein n=1 Tax=Saccharomonospora piscinae TaxID=687388 RepID=A0A1V9A141_SACPI|nr:hypothetical protein [Saccharomonospora piscinae]OQO90867.1 hypothetical protein B1813_15195 [Saccharomonospora piscinae]
MAPGILRRTPHDGGMLDRTGILGASAPPGKSFADVAEEDAFQRRGHRSRVAGLAAVALMVAVALTGTSGDPNRHDVEVARETTGDATPELGRTPVASRPPPSGEVALDPEHRPGTRPSSTLATTAEPTTEPAAEPTGEPSPVPAPEQRPAPPADPAPTSGPPVRGQDRVPVEVLLEDSDAASLAMRAAREAREALSVLPGQRGTTDDDHGRQPDDRRDRDGDNDEERERGGDREWHLPRW